MVVPTAERIARTNWEVAVAIAAGTRGIRSSAAPGRFRRGSRAFTNNDYVAVHDPSGKPAFEMITDLATNWVMEEPPSMMWNTRYGMMGGLGNRVAR